MFEIEKSISNLTAFSQNNKKLEKCLFSAANDDKAPPETYKRRSAEGIRSSSGSKTSNNSLILPKLIHLERTPTLRTQSYTPAKVMNVLPSLFDFT